MKEKRQIISPEEILSGLSSILKKQALDGWEIYLIQQKGLSIESRDQKLESFKKEVASALALRILKGKRLGFGYSSDLRNKSLERLVKEITENLKELSPDPDFSFPENQPPAQKLDIYHPAEEISESQKIQRAFLIEKGAREVDERIQRVRSCEYQERIRQIWIVNSNGLNQRASSSFFSAQTLAVAEDKGEAQIAGEFDWSYRYDMLNPETVGRSAGRKALSRLGARAIPSQKLPAIFTPEVAGEFLEILSFAFSGENLAKNKSWLKDFLGKKVFSEKISLLDDGSFLMGPDTFPFDDEGVNTQKKLLVEQGKLVGFLYDTYYARKFSTSSTGNAFRAGAGAPPRIAPSNFYIPKGDKSQQELIKSLEKGLLVEEVLGIHTADEISGEFSLGITGRMIEKGAVSFPVRGIAIAGTLKELFAKIVEIGSDLKFYSGCGSGSLLIEELEISGG